MIRKAIFSVSFLALVLPFLTVLPVWAQGEEIRPLRLDGLMLNGLHSYFTQSWATLEVMVTNSNPMGREGRVVVFFADQPDVQYARDLWIPPRSTVSTWMLVGPAPAEGATPAAPPSRKSRTRELQALIYDRTGGQDRLLLPPGQDRIRTRLTGFRPREPLTCMLLDNLTHDETELPPGTPPPPETDEALELVRAFRANSSRNLSDHVLVITDTFLPPTPEAFDGVDHFVLAARRIADDPPGQITLRRWLEQGGKLWVMLDRTDPDLVARILGGVPGFHVVDRTSLTTVHIETQRATSSGETPTELETATREFEQPVDLVRVKVGSEFTILNTVNGWPASFTRNVGQGKVIITTLGARGWCRPRVSGDSKSPFENFPNLPITLPAMDLLTQELLPPPEANLLPAKALEPLVSGDIGYSVVSMSTAGMIFAGFLLLMMVLAISLRKWGRLEVLGWMGPVVALSTGATFLALGEVSRRSVPPTLAVAQIVAVNPQTADQAVAGLLGFYRPDSGPISLSSGKDGILDLDMGGLEGHQRRFVVTDVDQWHWEGLSLPAGVRLGTFRSVSQMVEPISVVAHFGPEGLEGKASFGRIHGIGDVLIQAPSQRAFAVRLHPDGAFSISDRDLLPPGLFVSGTVLSDLQQRRQVIYRRLLTEGKIGLQSENSLLVASADPIEIPFTFESGLPVAGSALLSVPLEMVPTKPDTRVTVPRSFMAFRRIISLGATQPNMEGQQAMEQHLRFQVPPSILPLKVEKARLFAKVDIPMRRFTIRGHSIKRPVEVRSFESPVDLLELEITREDVLTLDEQGGLHLDIEVGEAAPDSGERPPKWTLHSLEIELIGRTLEGHQ